MRAEDERAYADYVGARTGALPLYAHRRPDAARNAVLRALTARMPIGIELSATVQML